MTNTFIKPGRRRPFRSMLGLGVGLGAMMATAGTVAVAQESGDQADEDVRRLNTIEVSATRREGVTVQDVPIAVTAFDAELVKQSDITDLVNIAQLSPSVLAGQGQSASAGTAISIRGLGTPSDDFGFEPAVGIFIDGVFRTRTGVAAQELPQLAGVEVLRGPQGTLFGRNTSAGVVSFNTAKPEFDPRVTATVGYGNFDELEVSLTATGETIKGQASRLDFKFRERDGIISDANSDNEFNDLDRFFVRFQHLWEGENASVRFIADYTQTNENCCAGVQLGTFETGPGAFSADVSDLDNIILTPVPEGTVVGGAVDGVVNFLAGSGLGGVPPLIGVLGTGDETDDTRFDGAFSPDRPFTDDIQDWGFSLEYNRDFSFGKFTSISAYRQFDSIRSQDIDFSGIDRAFRDGQTNDDRTFTQELRLQGLAFDDRLDWLVGAFYLNQRIDATETIRFGAQANQFTDLVALTGAAAAAGAAFAAGEEVGPIAQLFGSVPDPLAEAFVGGVLGDFAPLILAAAPGGGVVPGAFSPFVNLQTETGDGNNDDIFNLDTNSIAIFSHNNFSLTDRLTLTGGIRYTYERKDFDVDLNTIGVPACDAFLNGVDAGVLGGLLGLAPATGPEVAAIAGPAGLLVCNPAINPEFDGVQDDDRTENEVTGTVKLSYEVTPDILFYAGYSRGFKSGSFNLTRSGFSSSISFGGLPPVDDSFESPLSELEFEGETVDAYEAGLKTSWLDGRYTLNISGYFQDVDDFQENVFNGTNFITVGSEVESFGVEVDWGANPIDGLVLQGGFAYNSVERQDAIQAGSSALLPNTQLGGVPEFVVTGQGTYTREIIDGIEGVAHLNFRWNSEFATSSLSSNLILGDQEAFATVGIRLSVQDTAGRWRASFLAENLFDEEFNVASFGVPEQTFGTPETTNFAVFPGNPRFFGGEISVTF